VKDPLGGMQLGGSLIDTTTVPVPAVGIGALPPLQPIPANSKTVKAHHKRTSVLDIEQDFMSFPLNWKLKTKRSSTRASINTPIRRKF